jgi:hypothetical protein
MQVTQAIEEEEEEERQGYKKKFDHFTSFTNIKVRNIEIITDSNLGVTGRKTTLVVQHPSHGLFIFCSTKRLDI